MSSPTLTVSARWLGAYRCDVTSGDFTIPVDEPESVGGTNQGPQPTELLLAALSSCFTLAVAYSAAKRGIELSHLGVEVTGTYDGPRFSALEIRVDAGCADDVKERLLAAAARVCYVSNTIRDTPEMSVRAVAEAERIGAVDGDSGEAPSEAVARAARERSEQERE